MTKPGQHEPDFAACWHRASERMEQLRREALQDIDLPAIIEALEEPFQAALASMEPSTTSGLVEQQRLFMKGHQ